MIGDVRTFPETQEKPNTMPQNPFMWQLGISIYLRILPTVFTHSTFLSLASISRLVNHQNIEQSRRHHHVPIVNSPTTNQSPSTGIHENQKSGHRWMSGLVRTLSGLRDLEIRSVDLQTNTKSVNNMIDKGGSVRGGAGIGREIKTPRSNASEAM